MLASTFLLGWGRDEWPAQVVCRYGRLRSSGKIRRRAALSFLDHLTAVRRHVPRCGYPLTAIVENDNPRADGCCTPAENPAGLNGFDDGKEAKPVIDRIPGSTLSGTPGRCCFRLSQKSFLIFLIVAPENDGKNDRCNKHRPSKWPSNSTDAFSKHVSAQSEHCRPDDSPGGVEDEKPQRG
jgi:hypothetical protein